MKRPHIGDPTLKASQNARDGHGAGHVRVSELTTLAVGWPSWPFDQTEFKACSLGWQHGQRQR